MDDYKTKHLFIEADRGIAHEKDGKRRCMGCMELYSTEFDLCPECGYQHNTEVENALHMYPGTVLNDKYIIGKVLGYGGFGVTYLAWDTVLQTKVAIKEYLPSEFSTRSAGQTRITVFSGEKSKQFSDGMEKFTDEAKRLALFRSEAGIVKIFDSFEANGTAYIAMEYLEGETLAEYLEKEKTVSVEKAVKMLMPVIESLNKVHDEGIIHRDIAPDNIFLTNKGEVKLIDFGASRYATTSRSRSLTVIIKPGYSAEEQYRSRGDQGSHTDVYSIGAVLYRMITGQTPPDAMERRAQYEKNRKDILVPITKYTKEISKNYANAIYNAMNVRIEDRTPDMISLAGELMSEEPVKRRRSGLKKIDPLTWPLWAKIGVPSGIVVTVTLCVLLAFGIIGPKSTLRTDFEVPEGQTLIPSIVSFELAKAEKRLEKYDLQLRIMDKKQSETIKSGLVLMHVPDAGNIVPIGTYIDVTLSVGLGTEFVENVVGLTVEEAKSILEKQGFSVKTKEKRNSEYGAGIVFEQSVKENTALEKGSEITLYVSKGKNTDTSVEVNIPNVVGKTYDEAKNILNEYNLVIVKSSNVVYDASKKVGEVISQSPSANTSGHAGDRITVTVNAGIKKVNVIDVIGLSKNEAVKSLEALGLKVAVKSGKNEKYTPGTVYAQSIAKGDAVIPGTEITITVSEEIKVTVPNVTGMSLSEAQSVLKENDLSSMKSSEQTSYTYAKGEIISQSPSASSKVAAGTTVNLVVSLGVPTTTKKAETEKSTTKPVTTEVEKEENFEDEIVSSENETNRVTNKQTTTTNVTTTATKIDYMTISGVVALETYDGYKTSYKNGVLDSTDERLSGIKVCLYESSGKPAQNGTCTTDQDGSYCFDNIEKASYYIVFEYNGTDYKLVDGATETNRSSISSSSTTIKAKTCSISSSNDQVNLLLDNLYFDLAIGCSPDTICVGGTWHGFENVYSGLVAAKTSDKIVINYKIIVYLQSSDSFDSSTVEVTCYYSNKLNYISSEGKDFVSARKTGSTSIGGKTYNKLTVTLNASRLSYEYRTLEFYPKFENTSNSDFSYDKFYVEISDFNTEQYVTDYDSKPGNGINNEDDCDSADAFTLKQYVDVVVNLYDDKSRKIGSYKKTLLEGESMSRDDVIMFAVEQYKSGVAYIYEDFYCVKNDFNGFSSVQSGKNYSVDVYYLSLDDYTYEEFCEYCDKNNMYNLYKKFFEDYG